VKDDEVVAHYARAAEAPGLIRIDQLIERFGGRGVTVVHPTNAERLGAAREDAGRAISRQ
jgi:hypothetical protein